MGSISSPWDNAAMESLMGIVRAECVHALTYATREEAALDLFEYIEVVYNRARIHSALGYLSPVEFEEANWPTDEGRPMDWDNIMGTENRAFRLERCSNYARKTLRQAIQALRREIGSRGRDPGQGGLSDQLNVPCCTLGRWAAEYEADGEDAFPGNGNPVANKDYEILKLKKACGALGVGRGGRASDKGANVLNREFSVQKRNSVWCGDITYIPTREGWPCLATYIDLFSRKIVGWQVFPASTRIW